MTLEAAIQQALGEHGAPMTLVGVVGAVEKRWPEVLEGLNPTLAVHATLLLMKTNGVVRTPQPGYFELVH